MMPRTRPAVGVDGRTSVPAAGSQWSAAEARRVLESWHRSGLSLAAFARQAGVGRERLAWWRRRLKLSGPGRSARPQRFVPLIVKPAGEAQVASTIGVEVVLRGGRLVRVGVGFDAGTLGRVVEVLERTGC